MESVAESVISALSGLLAEAALADTLPTSAGGVTVVGGVPVALWGTIAANEGAATPMLTADAATAATANPALVGTCISLTSGDGARSLTDLDRPRHPPPGGQT